MLGTLWPRSSPPHGSHGYCYGSQWESRPRRLLLPCWSRTATFRGVGEARQTLGLPQAAGALPTMLPTSSRPPGFPDDKAAGSTQRDERPPQSNCPVVVSSSVVFSAAPLTGPLRNERHTSAAARESGGRLCTSAQRASGHGDTSRGLGRRSRHLHRDQPRVTTHGLLLHLHPDPAGPSGSTSSPWTWL